MKRLVSILLLFLLLLNIGGYTLYTLLGDDHQTSALFSDSMDMTLKVPVSLPYVSSYENIDPSPQELLYNDNVYMVSSRKIADDTLYIDCDFKGSARERFWSLVSSLDGKFQDSHPAKGKTASLIKTLLKEYMNAQRQVVFFILEWKSAAQYPPFEQLALTSFSASLYSPPDYCDRPVPLFC